MRTLTHINPQTYLYDGGDPIPIGPGKWIIQTDGVASFFDIFHLTHPTVGGEGSPPVTGVATGPFDQTKLWPFPPQVGRAYTGDPVQRYTNMGSDHNGNPVYVSDASSGNAPNPSIMFAGQVGSKLVWASPGIWADEVMAVAQGLRLPGGQVTDGARL